MLGVVGLHCFLHRIGVFSHPQPPPIPKLKNSIYIFHQQPTKVLFNFFHSGFLLFIKNECSKVRGDEKCHKYYINVKFLVE